MPFLKKKKNPFEASMVIDNPDVKVVEARYNGKPFVFGVGTSAQREVKGSGEVSLPAGAKGKYESQKNIKWNILYNPKVLPDFMPIEKAREFAASTVAVTGSTMDFFSTEPVFRVTGQERLKELEKRLKERMAGIQGAGLLDDETDYLLREISDERIRQHMKKRKPKARK